MSGKGSRPRPYSVSQSTFESNWDAIFGKKENKSQDDDKNTVNDSDTSELSQGSSAGRAPD